MNRILGTIFALATLAAIAYAIMNAGNYTSICFTEDEVPMEDAVVEVIPEQEMTIERDSVEIVEARDSLQ